MPESNEAIARHFDELADLLEIQGANPFRVRAYRNGARAVRTLGRDLGDLVDAGVDLSSLPDIGDALAAKIVELIRTGGTEAMTRLHRELPAGLEDLLRIPGLGPRRVRQLHDALGVRTLEQLAAAARDGRLEGLPGFGPRIRAGILDSLAAHREKKRRILRAAAVLAAESLTAWLRGAAGVDEVAVAGSYRRGRETVGDLDILVSATGDAVMDRFVAYGEVAEVLAQGPTRASVLLHGGLQVDLRLIPREGFGAALQYFTGSRAHNIRLRRLGQQRGLKINEYGVFRGDRRIAGETEESVYRAVGLAWIAPELREGGDEIPAAAAGALPALVTPADLEGDLHCHTRATDGRASLREMALAARARGLRYLAVTDHSRRSTAVNGLDARRLRRQMAEIDRLNAELRGITLLKGIECDILEDGCLDLDDGVLAELDLVIGAVHHGYDLPRARQTARILRAMDHPSFTLLAHPTGRLIGERRGYAVDLERIVRHAAERGCYLELDAQPRRLDLDDAACRLARSAGVLVAIDSDAHSPADLDDRLHGVIQARRGWLEPGDVLNTRPLRELRRLLRAARA